MTNKQIEEFLEKTLGKGSSIISPLVGGMMNLSFIVQNAKGKKFVLYISTKQANEMVDRKLEKEHQFIIHSLKITSKNVFFNVKDGIKINEYIEGNSLNNVTTWNYPKVAELFKKLHSSKALSKQNYNPFKRFLEIYESERKKYQAKDVYDYIVFRDFLLQNRKFLESQNLTLCHNDAQRSNIIQTPDDKYLFIDFEFVGNNDPLYDVAAFGNTSVAEGRILLDYYCNYHPTKEEIRRYYLWRIFISLQWYNVAITKHYRKEGKKHGYDFMEVANFFFNNAKDAYEGYTREIKL